MTPHIANMYKYLDTIKDRPFDWDGTNCAMTAADLYAAAYGEDHAAKFREACRTPLTCMRAVRDANGMDELLRSIGFVDKPASFARRADPVTLDTGKRRIALGICIDHRAAFAGKQGIEMIPLARCRNSWRAE